MATFPTAQKAPAIKAIKAVIFDMNEEIRRYAELSPIPGVTELLEDLHNHGIKLALATSGSKVRMEAVLEILDLQTAFTATLSAEDVKNAKPGPEIFLKAAQRLDVSPESCVVIEESADGVTAAKQAGMFCIGYQGQAQVDQDLSEADWIVRDFSELTYKSITARFNRSET
ncbi:MAG: HAD family hydrolase [bacterium]